MLRALNTAATGMAAQEANVNTIANNIANVNTTGFKKGRTEFEELLYQTIQEPGARSSATTQYNVGNQVGTGAKVAATKRIHTQGGPTVTNNPFDLMINGDGLFAVMGPNGDTKYTRDGNFAPDGQGNIVNSQGYKLFPGFVVPPNISSVNISEDGKVDVYFQGQPEPQTVGTIPVFMFANSAGLKSEGKNLYSTTSASGAPIQTIPGQSGSGNIQQGSLESSNVNIMTEMTDMIKAQRAYEMNARVLGVADQMMQATSNIK